MSRWSSIRVHGPIAVVIMAVILLLMSASQVSGQHTNQFEREFPLLDVSKKSIDLAEIKSGGVPRDAIPAIMDARFVPTSAVTELGDDEPVIFLTGQCGAYAFPYRMLIRHEIVHHDH